MPPRPQIPATAAVAVAIAVALAIGAAAGTVRADGEDAPQPARLEDGRRMTGLFLSGAEADLDALHARFDRTMSARMDRAALAAFRAQVGEQLGRETLVERETLDDAGGYETYVRISRFEGTPGPVETRWAFDAEGRIAGFFVRLKPEAAGSRYLDYETKTALHLPFRGSWYVFWGGRDVTDNYHASSPNQRFAYDLVQRSDGKTHRGDGTRNQQYYCWNAPILAPAAGTVVVAVDGVTDNVPGTMNAAKPPGNHAILDHGNGEYTVLAHFRNGTLRVAVGDRVEAGQELGRCGNSGNSSEPHLHLHLQTEPTFGRGDGLPAPFLDYVADGIYVPRGEPVRGQTIRAAHERDRP